MDSRRLSEPQIGILVDEELRGAGTRAYAIAAAWTIEPAVSAGAVREALEHAVREVPGLRRFAIRDANDGWAALQAPERAVDLRSWDGAWELEPGASAHLARAVARGRNVPLPGIYGVVEQVGRLVLGLDHVFVDGASLIGLDSVLADGLGAAGSNGACALPPVDPVATGAGDMAVARRALDRDTLAALRRRARTRGVTPFALLGARVRDAERRAGAGRFGVAVLAAGADARGDLDQLARIVPVPLAQNGDRETAAEFASALAQADVAVGTGRSQAGWTVLVEEPRRRSHETGGVRLRAGPGLSLGPRYMRLWTWRQVDADVELVLEHDSDAESAGMLDRVIAGLVETDDEPVAASVAAVCWGRRASGLPARVTSLVHAAALRHPDRVAVDAVDGRLTYAELWAGVTRASDAVRTRTDTGASVLVRTGRTGEHVVALLAILEAERVYVPYDPSRFGPESADEVAAAAGAVWLLDPGRGTWERVGPAVPRSAVFDEAAYVLFTSGSTGRPKPVWVGHDVLVNLIDWQVRRSEADATWRTLQFAAGTFDVSLQEALATLASGGALVVPDDATRSDPRELVGFMRARAVDRIFVPYVVLAQLATVMVRETKPIGLREVVTAGEALHVSEALRAWLAREPGVTLDNQYGPTETHVVTAHRLADDPAPWPESPPIGVPIQGVGIVLIDERAVPIALGDTSRRGELCVVGTSIGLGYGSGAAAGGFGPIPALGAAGTRAYRTGDIARWRADGALDFLGRRDDQVKINGIRLQLGEAEARLRELAAVRDAAVIVTGAGGARRLVAFVVPAAQCTGPSLRHALARAAPAHIVPAAIRLVDELPVNTHGKVDRRALAAVLDADESHAVRVGQAKSDIAWQQDGAAADLRAAAAEAWEDVLTQPAGHPDDSFFEAGGDSLAAVRLLARVQAATGRYVALRRFVTRPTPAGLLAELGGAADEVPAGHRTTGRTVVRLRRRRSSILWSFFPPMSGAVTRYAGMARLLPVGDSVWACETPPALPGRRLQHVAGAMADALVAERVEDVERIYLSGYSLGAVFALEVARALEERHAAGASPLPAHVFMLDPPPPGTGAPTQMEIFEIFVKHGWRLERPVEALIDSSGAPDIARIAAAARVAGSLEPGAPDATIADAWAAYVSNGALLEHYLPSPLDRVPVALLRCTGGEHLPCGWHESPTPIEWSGVVAPDRCAAIETEHFALLAPPVDEIVARWLVSQAACPAPA